MNEKELLEAIAKAEYHRTAFKSKISKLQKEVMEIESALIEATIKKDRLLEQLESLRNSRVDYELTERELEIVGFRERFSKYSKIIDAENEALNLKKMKGLVKRDKRSYISRHDFTQL